MPHHHQAQLYICHEPIGERLNDRQGRYDTCNLPAESWCYDEQMYVCEMHAMTRHESHHLRTIADESTDTPSKRADTGERRHGDRRRP